jgi:hypothetical protein
LHRQVRNRVGRALEFGHGGGVSVGDQPSESADHQIEWTWIRGRRQSLHRTADVEKDLRAAKVVSGDGGAPRGQIGPTGKAELERLKLSRSV